jgi:oxidase EvaA
MAKQSLSTNQPAAEDTSFHKGRRRRDDAGASARSVPGRPGPDTIQDVADWLDTRRAAADFRVARKPLGRLKGWMIDPATGNVRHESGKFFQIAGVEVRTNFGAVGEWSQPIVYQREVGLIGFLSQKIAGIPYFLVQAKMEPGNVNLVQLSPTVQATRSNFTQVHGGQRPRYIEYFLNCPLDHVLVDQLQSEQGSKFYRKRNRNMVVRVPDDVHVPMHEDFAWLTLEQIQRCVGVANCVNMDARSVLSGISAPASLQTLAKGGSLASSGFHEDVVKSTLADDRDALLDLSAVVRWFAAMKARYQIEATRVGLKDLEDWAFDGESLHHVSGRFFSVIGVEVSASTREVVQWDQPLIESAKGGIVCLLCQKFDGVLHFLFQARVEAGVFDGAEMAPTLQFTPANYEPHVEFPPFTDVFYRLRPEQVRYDSLQSEEGGRFYHDQNRYVVAETAFGEITEIPENFSWLTMRQIKDLLRFNNCFNIEARSLVACVESIR